MVGELAFLLAIVALGQSTVVPENSRLGKTCPVVDGYWTTFLRDVYNCNRYYKCSNGKAIPQRCPPGLFFHPRLLVCDFPLRTGCRIIPHFIEAEAMVSEDEPTLDTPVVLFEEAPVEEDAEGFVIDGPHLAWSCPKVDGPWPTYIIDRTHCNRYYECSNGKPILQQCPTGLFFNWKKLACDKRENVTCMVLSE